MKLKQLEIVEKKKEDLGVIRTKGDATTTHQGLDSNFKS